MNKEKRLEELQQKINSMHINIRYTIEQIGALVTFFCIYAPTIVNKLYNPGYINLLVSWVLILPAVVTAAVLPILLADYRKSKLITFQQESKKLKIELMQKKIKQKINHMSYEEKIIFLKEIVFFEDVSYGLDSNTFNEIIFKITQEIEKNNKNISLDVKTQMIAPIDRTYDETANHNHTKKLHI